jgi:hypothetical protein
LPSRINCVVPVGVGAAGEMVVVTVTLAPCETVDGVRATAVVLGKVASPTVKDAGEETDA